MKLFSVGTTDRNVSLGILILRLFSGLTMAFGHGLGKLQNYGAASETFPDPMGVGSNLSLILAISAELLCGVLLAIGFATRLVAIPLFITMVVAFFVIHSADPFGTKELAFIYMAMYLVIFITGPGKYSVDSMIKK